MRTRRVHVFLTFTFFLVCDICGTAGNSNRVPGITSFKQCYKYHGQEHLLTTERIAETLQNINKGYAPVEFSPDGVFGSLVLNHEFPFMAALGYGNQNNREYLCGGSLISDQFVLTAAHCIFANKGESVTIVKLGDLNIRSEDDDEGVQEYKVSKYIVHPNYTYPVRYNDIALIQLERQVTFTKYVKPICLQYLQHKYEYFDLYAAGWGEIGHGGEPSDNLLKFSLRFYDTSICENTYNVSIRLPRGFLNDLYVCAGAQRGLTDTCRGDSGGPLVFLKWINATVAFYQLGITSFGVTCGIAQLPAVYTRVSYYIKWIEDEVWPESTTASSF